MTASASSAASTLGTCWRCARPPFLVLAPLCAGLAITSAWHDGQAPGGVSALLVLLAALLAHAAVNLFNEHHDFASGLDATTHRTPFSGGSGALPEHPEAAGAVRRAAVACLAGVAIIGAWCLWRAGPVMLPYGLVGMALVLAYTGRLTRRPWLCLMAPGVGFGTLMVVGANQALTGGFSSTALAVSMVPTLMASALLLANQLPDIEPDRRAGRYHLAILLGARRAARLVALLVLAAFLVVPLTRWAGWLPAEAWLMWLAAPAALTLAIGLWRLPARLGPDEFGRLVPLLGLNVAQLLASLALLNLGLWLAA
ncbi:prenyltransferase [Halomonas aestuarii]|uniref:Prenyltransferase n=1 Tax=Halomonas aestuarii TaxID=1897729 RepID=A0A1J0VKN5_9GAMM|nr:prenyltransferase [Halomonas aestuarii]APE32575.1 prenyltransferase [Halomonas aestuarii]